MISCKLKIRVQTDEMSPGSDGVSVSLVSGDVTCPLQIISVSKKKKNSSSSLSLQQIMKDRWINTGFEEDELKPYTEPELDITDQKRIGTNMAASRLT